MTEHDHWLAKSMSWLWRRTGQASAALGRWTALVIAAGGFVLVCKVLLKTYGVLGGMLVAVGLTAVVAGSTLFVSDWISRHRSGPMFSQAVGEYEVTGDVVTATWRQARDRRLGLGIRNLGSDLPAALMVCSVTDPDGFLTHGQRPGARAEALALINGPSVNAVEVIYPTHFPGAAPLRSGIYSVEWSCREEEPLNSHEFTIRNRRLIQ
jgi:hypothetical protein